MVHPFKREPYLRGISIVRGKEQGYPVPMYLMMVTDFQDSNF